MNYSDFFKKAVQRTREKGFLISPVRITDKRYLNENLSLIFSEMLFDIYGESFSPEDLFTQCIRTHYHLISKIEAKFNCKAYLTIGSVRKEEHYYYEYSVDKILGSLDCGLSSILFHCWITLDSLEVIDATFLTTIGKVRKDSELIGQLISHHPSEFTRRGVNIVYEPMIIGEEFMRTIGVFPETGFVEGFNSSYKSPSFFKGRLIPYVFQFMDKI